MSCQKLKDSIRYSLSLCLFIGESECREGGRVACDVSWFDCLCVWKVREPRAVTWRRFFFFPFFLCSLFFVLQCLPKELLGVTHCQISLDLMCWLRGMKQALKGRRQLALLTLGSGSC